MRRSVEVPAGTSPGRTGVSSARPLPRGALSAALVLISAAVWMFHAWWTLARFDGARFTFDSAQYALAARELASTGRLATPFSYVGALRDGLGPPFPMLAGHPLLPILQAPVFALVGAGPKAAILPVLLAHLLTVVLAALLVLECGGGTALAACVGVTLAGTPAMLAFATDGLSEMPFTAAWTAAILLLAGFRRAPRSLAIGALLGLAHLARPVVAPTLPVWLVAVSWAAAPGARVRHATWLLSGFVPFAALMVLYKWSTTGHPFADVGGIMLLTGLSPEFGIHDVARVLHPPHALDWIRAHPGAFMEKLSHNVPEMARDGLHLGGWAAGLAFAWAVVRPVRDGLGPLRLLAGGSLALLAALAALTLPRSHYLFPMLPTVVALGAVSIAGILRSVRMPSRATPVVVALMLAWSSWRPLVRQWQTPSASSPLASEFTEREIAGLGATLAQRLPAGTLITSDMAPWFSWYARLPSVNLPLRLQDLAELRARNGVGAVVITNEWLVTLPGNEAWRDVFESRTSLPGWATLSVARSGRLRAHVLVPDSAAVSPPPAASPGR